VNELVGIHGLRERACLSVADVTTELGSLSWAGGVGRGFGEGCSLDFSSQVVQQFSVRLLSSNISLQCLSVCFWRFPANHQAAML